MVPDENEVLLYRIREAAFVLGFSPNKVYQLIRNEGLPVIRIGGSTRIPSDALRRWIEERTEYPATPNQSTTQSTA